MLNKRSNGALNNTLFSSLKMDLMTDKKTHPAMERIYRAMASRGLIAEERRQSALARLLNTSSQAVKNWESRGPSKDVRLEIQARYGISATWVENEAGDMLVDAGLSLSSNTQTSRMQAESLPAENASAGPTSTKRASICARNTALCAACCRRCMSSKPR